MRGVLADARRVLDWATVRRRMAAEIAAGMAHLPSLSIVHRDLKSDNRLYDGHFLKNVFLGFLLNTEVADFGASKLTQATKSDGRRPVYEGSLLGAETGTMITTTQAEHRAQTMTKGAGTPLWMAPEVLAGSSRYGPRGGRLLGIIMWELLTRREPWDEIETSSRMEFSRKLDQALASGRWPAVAAEVEQSFPECVALMRQCWATDRPPGPNSPWWLYYSYSLAPSLLRYCIINIVCYHLNTGKGSTCLQLNAL